MELEEALKQLEEAKAENRRLVNDLKAEQGKNSAIVADKNKYKTERDEARIALESAKNENLSVDEKWQKQIDDLKNEVLSSKEALAEKEKLAIQKERESKISTIAAGIKTIDGFSPDALKSLVSGVLSDVDLADNDKVTEAIDAFKGSNKAIIAAATPSGTGGKHDGPDSVHTNKPATMKDLMSEVWGDK